MAGPNCECPVCVLWRARGGRWPGMPLVKNWTETHAYTYIWQVFSPAKVIFAGVGVLLSVSIFLDTLALANLSSTIFRQRRTYGQAKTPSSTSSKEQRTFSDASRATLRWRRPRK